MDSTGCLLGGGFAEKVTTHRSQMGKAAGPQKDVLSQEGTEDFFKIREVRQSHEIRQVTAPCLHGQKRTDAFMRQCLNQEVTAVGSDDQVW